MKIYYEFNYEKSDIFSLGIIILRLNLLLNEINIAEINNIESGFEILRNNIN